MRQNPKLPIAVGLDVGSTAVRCVIGLHEEEAPAPSIIGVGVAANSGVRKGVVVDVENTVSAITAALDEAERISGVSVQAATIGVNGSHLMAVNARGIIAVGNGREITAEDLSRAEESATVAQLPPNREIVRIVPRSYSVDAQEHIKDPLGMNGMRLEVDSCLITAATPFLKNLTRSVTQAGISAHAHLPGILAAARVAAGQRERELGCAVLDIGAGTTGVAVFEEGELRHIAVLPVGAAHLSGDIAIGLRTDIEVAEQVTLKHLDVNPAAKTAGSFKVKELSGEILEVSTGDINQIARVRLEELFEMIAVELEKAQPGLRLPAGLLLVGGGASLKGLSDLAKAQLRLPARIVKPHGFSGIIDKIQDPVFASSIGLMLEDLYGEHSAAGGSISGVLSNTLGGLRSLLDRFRH